MPPLRSGLFRQGAARATVNPGLAGSTWPPCPQRSEHPAEAGRPPYSDGFLGSVLAIDRFDISLDEEIVAELCDFERGEADRSLERAASSADGRSRRPAAEQPRRHKHDDSIDEPRVEEGAMNLAAAFDEH